MLLGPATDFLDVGLGEAGGQRLDEEHVKNA
jgi:hypothetical protein